MAKVNIPTIKLNSGHTMPMFGLGTWKSKPGEVAQAVRDAIDAGYRHIDCAFMYGNEPEVGQAITEKIKEGVIKREDLFITSKLWNSFHSPELVVGACKTSVKDLCVSYLDLYLIHWPVGYKEGGGLIEKDADGKILYSDVDYVDTWKGMEDCVKQGLVKSIGVSNFNTQQIERVLKIANIKPVMNQIECNPYINQSKLISFCRSKDIQITGYSPLGSRDSPFIKPEDPKLLEDPRLVNIGKKYGKSAAQVALRYQIQRGVVTIPKSVHKSRIIENMNIFDFELSPDDITAIDAMNCGGRVCDITHAKNHQHYPFNIEY